MEPGGCRSREVVARFQAFQPPPGVKVKHPKRWHLTLPLPRPQRTNRSANKHNLTHHKQRYAAVNRVVRIYIPHARISIDASDPGCLRAIGKSYMVCPGMSVRGGATFQDM